MIKKLERQITESWDDGTQTSKLPSQEDSMNKINEIVAVVNSLEQMVKENSKWIQIQNITKRNPYEKK